MAAKRPELGLQSECPQAKVRGNLLTFDLSIKNVVLHALLAVSMPNINIQNRLFCVSRLRKTSVADGQDKRSYLKESLSVLIVDLTVSCLCMRWLLCLGLLH